MMMTILSTKTGLIHKDSIEVFIVIIFVIFDLLLLSLIVSEFLEIDKEINVISERINQWNKYSTDVELLIEAEEAQEKI